MGVLTPRNPHPYAPRAPFTVTGSTLSWEKGAAVVVEATLAWPEGPDVSLSLRKTPETLSVDPLVIRDKASDARVAFHIDPGAVKVKYAGTLSRAAVEKVVSIPARPGQRIHGEMEAVLDRGNPARSSARGTLEADDLAIPWKPLAPLAIRHVSLSAEGSKVRVTSSDLLSDNVPLSLTGTAEFGGETVVGTSTSPRGHRRRKAVRSIRRKDPGTGSRTPAKASPGRMERRHPLMPRFRSGRPPPPGRLRIGAGVSRRRPVRAEADLGEDRVPLRPLRGEPSRVSTLAP